ncbi:MAG: hypothetical protein GX604_09370 [Actinobacteria bacterium]|nr:hypothetical protein [Actinomycetota bacterium]
MTARERIMAFFHGEEPDKIPVFAYDASILGGQQGGWARRLQARGMGITRLVPPHQPYFFHPNDVNPGADDITYIETHYIEKGLPKRRLALETPVGCISSVVVGSPPPSENYACAATEEPFVKELADWRVVNYVFKRITDVLRPNYTAQKRMDDEVGDQGVVVSILDRTPFQRAWVDLADPVRAALDFKERPAEIEEYLDVQKALHERIAEIAAESPIQVFNVVENLTNIISPPYFSQYCTPFYKMYQKAFEGRDAVLGAHFDGQIGHITKEIGDAHLDYIDSYTVPPVGDVSLTEAKRLWPGLRLWINCPPHLAQAEPDEVRAGYELIAEEWGSKTGIAVNHIEEIPVYKWEEHLSAALDAFGY